MDQSTGHWKGRRKGIRSMSGRTTAYLSEENFVESKQKWIVLRKTILRSLLVSTDFKTPKIRINPHMHFRFSNLLAFFMFPFFFSLSPPLTLIQVKSHSKVTLIPKVHRTWWESTFNSYLHTSVSPPSCTHVFKVSPVLVLNSGWTLKPYPFSGLEQPRLLIILWLFWMKIGEYK